MVGIRRHKSRGDTIELHSVSYFIVRPTLHGPARACTYSAPSRPSKYFNYPGAFRRRRTRNYGERASRIVSRTQSDRWDSSCVPSLSVSPERTKIESIRPDSYRAPYLARAARRGSASSIKSSPDRSRCSLRACTRILAFRRVLICGVDVACESSAPRKKSMTANTRRKYSRALLLIIEERSGISQARALRRGGNSRRRRDDRRFMELLACHRRDAFKVDERTDRPASAPAEGIEKIESRSRTRVNT